MCLSKEEKVRARIYTGGAGEKHGVNVGRYFVSFLSYCVMGPLVRVQGIFMVQIHIKCWKYVTLMKLVKNFMDIK